MARSPFGPAADQPRQRFRCPQCGRASSHPMDLAMGYCGACKAFTGGAPEVLPGVADDPRTVPGSIDGPGGAFDAASVVVDKRNALLLEEADIAPVALYGRNRGSDEVVRQQAYVLELSGHRGAVTDGEHTAHDPDWPGRLVLLVHADGIAALISELMALYARHDPALHHAVYRRIEQRLTEWAEQPARRAAGAPAPEATAGTALLPDSMQVTLLDDGSITPPVAVEWAGRVSGTDDTTRVVVLATAHRVSEMLARAWYAAAKDPAFLPELEAQVAALRADGTYPRF